MLFGQGNGNFLVDSPAAVAQCVQTRLMLFVGDWWLDTSDGTPWFEQILQQSSVELAQAVIRDRILGTPFVTGIENLSVAFNDTTRALVVEGTINTAFGPAPLAFPMAPGPLQYGIAEADYSGGSAPAG